MFGSGLPHSQTKCDQARPTCGPCVYAGLMECTFLMGKTPVPKRKKAHTEVEILEARLETIESAYSERLSQMESLLNKVMPGVNVQERIKEGVGSSVAHGSAAPGTSITVSRSQPRQNTASTNESDWADIDSPQEGTQPLVSDSEQCASNTLGIKDRSAVSLFTPELCIVSTIDTPSQQCLKEEDYDKELFTRPAPTLGKSSASSVAQSPTATADVMHGGSDGDDDGDLSELAATMDKLRLFDASYYFGKGTMLFTSTDQNKFWDEEISFDVHDAQDIDIPPEALIMPPVEVIDALFDIYYSHYYVFLPMIQKTTLLQALEDRYEPQSVFLLNSVFMASALTGNCNHPSCFQDPNNPKTISTPFFERARLVLDYCIGIPRVSTVQGLILLSRYPKISGLGHHYIQQAILMATDLGLQRKCDRWIPDKQAQETRKRVFWCVYGVDSAAASITGRRPLIDDSEIDVPMVVPTTAEGELEYSNTLFLVHICKLWRIFRNVKQYIFNAVEVRDMVPGSLPRNYEQQLIQWQLQLPAALRFSSDMQAGDPRAIYNARAGVAQLLYESTLILLHKPYLSSDTHLNRTPYRSQDICIKAASKITDISRVLMGTFDRTFEITGVAEYAMVNAIRIQVMYMKSTDPKIAEPNQANFEYLMRFFREFYSAPRCNIDEQNINCILTFFDQFMHSVKGLSESTVHICAGAIKNLAIAKRSKIALGRHSSGVHGTHGAHGARPNPSPPGGDDRKLSRLVKIGREERAKARVNSAVSPTSLSAGDAMGAHRKRLSHSQHEGQQRFSDQHLQHPQNHHLHQHYHSHQDSLSSSPSSFNAAESSEDIYHHPGKFQKLSQYVGPFGGPLVMESLNHYQTSTAILSQPPSTSAIPQVSSVLSSSTDNVFQAFDQHQTHPQHVQPSQQPQQERHRSQEQFSQSSQTMQHLQIPMQQPLSLHEPAHPSLDNFDVIHSSFWGDFNPAGSASSSFQTDIQSQQSILTSGPNNSSIAATGLSNVTGTVNLASGFASPTNIYGISTGATFDPMEAQQQPQQQQQQQPGMFLPSKSDPSGNVPEGLDGELNADQIQALLDQTLAGDSRSNPHNLAHSESGSTTAVPLTVQQQQHRQQQQQVTQSHSLEQSGVRADFHRNSWHSMM
ncbi:Transcriptional activator of fatty acid utilization [Mortierella sp. GBA30]|nr:Transcriptional activator of fatty acid utilization [Mortierella sp. GBA30]